MENIAMTPMQAQIKACYQKKYDTYIAQTKDVDMQAQYALFLKYLPKNARILDVGFGSGRDLARFTALGYTALGVDIVEEFVAHALENGLCAQIADYHNLPFEAEFDGVWACASLLHSNNLPLAFANLARVLKVGGYVYLSMKYGEKSGLEGEMFYQYIREDKLESLTEGAGLRVVEWTISKDELGRENEWLNAILVK